MKYQPTIKIWNIPPALRKHIQPGQWIEAGSARGQYLGQTKTETDVVVWQRKGRYAKNRSALREYAERNA